MSWLWARASWTSVPFTVTGAHPADWRATLTSRTTSASATPSVGAPNRSAGPVPGTAVGDALDVRGAVVCTGRCADPDRAAADDACAAADRDAAADRPAGVSAIDRFFAVGVRWVADAFADTVGAVREEGVSRLRAGASATASGVVVAASAPGVVRACAAGAGGVDGVAIPSSTGPAT